MSGILKNQYWGWYIFTRDQNNWKNAPSANLQWYHIAAPRESILGQGTVQKTYQDVRMDQGSVNKLSKAKCKPCTFVLVSFIKRVVSRLGINNFPPLGTCKITSYVQCPGRCPSLGERYWYPPWRRLELTIIGGAEGDGLTEPWDQKEKDRQSAAVFNHWERGGQWKDDMFINHSKRNYSWAQSEGKNANKTPWKC